MNAPEFSGVVDSFRPLLWAIAVVVIIFAAVYGANQVFSAMLPRRESGAQLL